MPLGAAVQPSSSSNSSSSSSQSHRRRQSCHSRRENRREHQTDNIMPVTSESRRRRRRRKDDWIRSSTGNILYRTDAAGQRPTDSAPGFPAPLIGPRRTRPHSVHVVSYPSGYVPRELRVRPGPRSVRARVGTTSRRSTLAALTRTSRSDLPVRLALSRLFQTLSSNSLSTLDIPQHRGAFPVGLQPLPAPEGIQPEPRLRRSHTPPRRSTSTHQGHGSPPRHHKDNRPASHRDSSEKQYRVPGRERDRDRLRSREWQREGRTSRPNSLYQHQNLRLSQQYYPPNSSMAAIRSIQPPPNTYHLGPHRNSFSSVLSSKSSINTSIIEVPKPVVTGSGVACSILLAEPNLFLSGFDHDGHSRRDNRAAGTALLRGKLQLTVSKNVKIKAIQLKLAGRARTEWPEGIPPLKQDIYEEESLRTQVLTFFNALNDETEYGNQCTYKLKTESANSSSANLAVSSGLPPSSSTRNNLTSRELKRLSLQNVQSRSFTKGDGGVSTPGQVNKGFKVFYPGTYDYSFELPIDHHQLETIKLQYASVKWELHATIDRAGAFKPNLHGVKEVPIIRLPDQMSLEMTEPISISRKWEDQLHYDIMVSGKSFPIGAKIPIAFKLTPLAKVQLHKLKVFLTESVEYWTNDKRVMRKDAGRKILLLEKTAGKDLDSTWATSEINTLRGGEPSPEVRREAREIASRRRASEAARRKTAPEPLPPPSDNLLGDLDLGLETMWGSTEIEANVQIPTCEMMAKNKDLRLHPDCSWKNVNVYHWIKVVMRISRIDPEDPSGTKRRHFEISIDSPLTILNCRATQANTNLPAYSGSICRLAPYQSACGCPDSATIHMETSPSSSTGTLPDPDGITETMPAPPQAAHVHSASAVTGRQSPPRPMHLLRAPSFSPPAFDDDTAPPPVAPILMDDADTVMTPPPQYDAVVGTPSVDGLADYFARLAEYGLGNEEDSSSDGDETPPRILDRNGRVNVVNPRTPGGRRVPSRSVEIPRPLPDPSMDLNISVLLQRQARAAERTSVAAE